MDFLSARIADQGWSSARIGVEMDNYWFTAKSFASLQKHLPNAAFQDITALVNWQRAVKSAQELAYMRKAGKLVEKSTHAFWKRQSPVFASVTSSRTFTTPD